MRDVPQGRSLKFTVHFEKPEYLNDRRFLWIVTCNQVGMDGLHNTETANGNTPEEALGNLIHKWGWINLGNPE